MQGSIILNQSLTTNISHLINLYFLKLKTMNQDSLNNHYTALAQHYDKVCTSCCCCHECHKSSLISGVHHQWDPQGREARLHCDGWAGGQDTRGQPQAPARGQTGGRGRRHMRHRRSLATTNVIKIPYFKSYLNNVVLLQGCWLGWAGWGILCCVWSRCRPCWTEPGSTT